MKRLLAVLLFVALPAGGETLQEAIARATATAPFDRAIWFVHVEDDRGTVLASHNSNLLAISASVRKLFAAATVVECLGPDAQLETKLFMDGRDVVIRGGGDPSFGSDRYGYDRQIAFEPFIRALRARGVRRVRDVVADVSAFDRVTLPYQWKLGNLISDFAAPVDAIAYDENETNDEQPVPSPGLFAAAAFRDELVRAGIMVEGGIRTSVTPREMGAPLATIRSPFIHHLLTTVLKNSHNLFAEMLFKRTSLKEPASYGDARMREREVLREVGISDEEYRFVDGSGLAPDDLVTAAAVVKILRWMDAPPRRALYRDLLAQAGGEGTLRLRLTSLGGRLYGKTGTVAGVNSLAGIVTNSEGRTRYVAIIVNHHTGSSSAATRLLDSIMQAAGEW